MKLIYEIITLQTLCKLCSKIQLKRSRIVKEQDKIKDSEMVGNHCASIATSQEQIAFLEREINYLETQRSVRLYPLPSGAPARSTHLSQTATGGSTNKRRLDDGNDEDAILDAREPKRPSTLLRPAVYEDDYLKLACPYRKKDPRKYSVRDWRSCALTPHETVARVKSHLYRLHRVFPCQRCKENFRSQEEVIQHLNGLESCPLRDIRLPEGITSETVEKLRSRKKTSKDQTEQERWKEIYKLLFKDELIPSPYFEPVQEIAQSSDSRALVDCEEYCRRELPRTVRVALENIVQPESQPILDNINSQLMNIIGDCLNRVFTTYRASTTLTSTTLQTPSITKRKQELLTWNPSEAITKVDFNFSLATDTMFRKDSSTLELPTSYQSHPQQAQLITDMEHPEDAIATSMLPSSPSISGHSSQPSAESPTTSSGPSVSNHHPHPMPQYQAARSQLPPTCITGVDLSQLPISCSSDTREPNILVTETTQLEGLWMSNMDDGLPDGFDWDQLLNLEPSDTPDPGSS
ncbi:hypothetical protein BDZ45DRAFT_812329 [Acephala macrosclerotiorum]|nr:hypothetical protein BDZ45DRAFT_812329 [Acephala macrosclerotiorum]